MGLAEDADAALEALYAQVPEVNCQGLCTDCCGPVDAGPREKIRLIRAGVRLPPRRQGAMMLLREGEACRCPALVDGRCSVYRLRPMICRLFGASVDIRCPYRCGPAPGVKLLSSGETMALLDAANCIGSGRKPMPPEYFEEVLRDPANMREYRKLMATFTATQPIPPKRAHQR